MKFGKFKDGNLNYINSDTWFLKERDLKSIVGKLLLKNLKSFWPFFASILVTLTDKEHIFMVCISKKKAGDGW